MPARTHAAPEMPASLLIDLHRDPERYEAMINEISAREGVAREVEATAGERIKAAEAAEVRAQEAQAQAEASAKKSEAAAKRADDAKTALAIERDAVAGMRADAEAKLQEANDLSDRIVALLRGHVSRFATEAEGVLAAAQDG